MVYALKKVRRSGLYRLNDAINYFIVLGLDKPIFSAACFPSDFGEIFSSHPKFRNLSQNLYKAVNGPHARQKQVLRSAWKSVWDIRALTQDPNLPVVNVNSLSSDASDAVEKLFTYFYDEMLRTEGFESIAATTHRKHYEAFYLHDQIVCPFCGLELYMEAGGDVRENYDHFLARSVYPLGGVNFHNLVPMCVHCNCPQRKGHKNVLQGGSIPARPTRIPYPYGPIAPLVVHLDQLKPAGPKNAGEWKVSLKAVVHSEADMVANWDRVFCICDRYKLRVQARGLVWVDNFMLREVRDQVPTVVEVRAAFDYHAKCLMLPEVLRTQPEALLESAYFRWHAANSSEAFYKARIRNALDRKNKR